MARDTTDFRPIESVDELVDHLAEGNKPRDKWRIGTEHEKFPFYVDGNAPVPYGGERGIRALLEGMQQKLGWDPILDAGRIIGLVEPTGQGAISLEPGGQFELSGAPLETIHQTCREGNAHLAQLREIAEPLGIRFLGLGGSPKWTLAETPKMPKSRYEIMTRYMPKVGTKGLDMMYRTCTIQVNLDFESEADMRRKMQVSLKLQPLSTALFANSPFHREPAERVAELARRHLARHRQPALRTARILLLARFRLRRLCRMGARRADVFRHSRRPLSRHDPRHLPPVHGRALPRNYIPDGLPTMGDWANHLSTLFPDVRLKRFLEMRGADGGPWRRICALPAFWVGLLYDEAALDAAETLTSIGPTRKCWRCATRCRSRHFGAEFRNTTLREIARDVLVISRMGLKNRARKNRDGYDETSFLNTLDEVVARGTTSAEEMLSRLPHALGRLDRAGVHGICLLTSSVRPTAERKSRFNRGTETN